MRILILVGLLGVALFHTACNDKGESGDSTGSSDNDQAAIVEDESGESLGEGSEKVFVLSNDSRIEWRTAGSDEADGRFENFVGKIVLRDGKLAGKQGHFVTVDLGSVAAENPELMARLKSEDPLNTRKFPIARFQIIDIKSLEDGMSDVSGVLDFHGVGQRISFPASVSLSGKETILDVSAELTINLSDFELGSDFGESTIMINLNAMPGEPQSLVLQDTTVSEEETRRGLKGKGAGAKGKGRRMSREEWENLSEEERQERRRQRVAEMDTNQDGNLGRDEVPEQAWQFIGRADTNGDEMISPEERDAFRVQMQAEREMRELSGEGPPAGFGGKGRKGGGDRPPR